MKRAVGAAAALVLAVASIALVHSGSQDASADQTAEPIDDDIAGVLVEDWESPSSVSERAETVLRERYVDLRITDDHSHYVVGVLHLMAEERSGLEERLSGDAPVTVESRDVPLAESNAAREAVEKEVLASGMPFTMISTEPRYGVVHLQVPTAKETDEAVSLVTQALPGMQRVTPVAGGGTGTDIAVNPTGASATVEVRVVDAHGTSVRPLLNPLTEQGRRSPLTMGRPTIARQGGS